MDKRMAYFVQYTVKDENGNFVPCIVVEGEKGYHKTDWQWGKDYDIANSTAKLMNDKLGLSELDAIQIVLSTMGIK